MYDNPNLHSEKQDELEIPDSKRTHTRILI